ncbi:GNAT family N-acetyltransferase [Catenuloplanes sp. NPDC051500]|uniref:GNAT family N-acetyltransferase n=1 Tax=Catenuloplanes sp. NPDC051500 TaxID=3363959 RepID=UPI0037B12921
MTDTDIVPLAIGEAAEGVFTRVLAENAPAGIELRTLTIGTATALALRSDSLMFNRVIGFSEPVSAEVVARFVTTFREAGSLRATLKFPPSVLPDDWDAVCATLGLTAGPATVKLSRSTAAAAQVETDLRIAPVAAHQRQRAVEVMLTGFDDRPPYLVGMLGAMTSHPQSRQFAAWDGDEMVAVGLVFTHGEIGLFKGGVTLPSHRGRGAQSALIAARIEAARAAGCRWVVSETSQPAAGEHHTSLSNLERAGFVRVWDYRNVLLT